MLRAWWRWFGESGRGGVAWQGEAARRALGRSGRDVSAGRARTKMAGFCRSYGYGFSSIISGISGSIVTLQ